MTECTPLHDRLRLQELVAGISTRFTGLYGPELEHAIQDALVEIGSYFEVDAVRLYRLSLQGDVLKVRHAWRSEHLTPPEELAEILKLKYPNLAAHYANDESTVFGNIDDSPPWPEMRKILPIFGTKAGVGVPLEIDGAGVDVFAMDKVLSECVWAEDIVEQCQAIGRVMLAAVRRREAEVELQESHDEVRRLKDRLEAENSYLRQEVHLDQPHARIIGQSPSIRKALQQVEQVAKTNSTVLLGGETGTGKELFAEAIHDLSSRRQRTLVKVNCAALPDTLVESELFGREKGAYTGALTKQVGRFEVAHQSTIFLDEIGELSLDVQAKLLRVLQEGEFERLGSAKSVKVDVRIIAATNRDLSKAVQEGTFRDDLYYRLFVFPIVVPPLRERAEDIPQLVWHFVREFTEGMGKHIEHISKGTMASMLQYPWPGNIRELRNVIERAMIISTSAKLEVGLPTQIEATGSMSRTLEEAEQQHIISVLEQTGWRVRGAGYAADILGLKPTTLEFRMKKLGIERPQ